MTKEKEQPKETIVSIAGILFRKVWEEISILKYIDLQPELMIEYITLNKDDFFKFLDKKDNDFKLEQTKLQEEYNLQQEELKKQQKEIFDKQVEDIKNTKDSI